MFPLHALTAIAPASPAGAPGHRQAGSTLFLDMLKPGARLHAMVQTRVEEVARLLGELSEA